MESGEEFAPPGSEKGSHKFLETSHLPIIIYSFSLQTKRQQG